MSPASYLTAPPRGVGIFYHRIVAIWIALAVFVVGLIAGLVFAVFRGFRLWRHAKRTGATFGQETERIARVADEIAVQLERANASSARLTEATTRLRSSAARLQVQRAAVIEARAALARTFWFLPGR
jgi:hypothetical protein